HSLDRLVQEVLQGFSQANHPCQIEPSLDIQPITRKVDAAKIKQMLTNLISNAVKFSPNHQRVQIASQWIQANQTQYYQLTVKDQGIGMTQEQVDHIFDKFYRVDASKTGFEGIGLGMSIAKQIVDAHDGHIWVESQLGVGTKVTVIL
ncbi:MAG: ATP-binding protein, partial [Chloroflexota bacterium]